MMMMIMAMMVGINWNRFDNGNSVWNGNRHSSDDGDGVWARNRNRVWSMNGGRNRMRYWDGYVPLNRNWNVPNYWNRYGLWHGDGNGSDNGNGDRLRNRNWNVSCDWHWHRLRYRKGQVVPYGDVTGNNLTDGQSASNKQSVSLSLIHI